MSNELLAFEDGQINHYFGAYSDYLAVKTEEKSADKAVSKIESPISTDKTENTDKTKLTYMEKKEWETIESQIAEIEERISQIEETVKTAPGKEPRKFSSTVKVAISKSLVGSSSKSTLGCNNKILSK